MIIRHTEPADIPFVLTIYNQAKEYMKNKGINQWQDGYPNEESLRNDISLQQSYVLIDKEIIGTCAIILTKDNNYDYIENGQWLTTEDDYLCIHRIAIHNTYKGQNMAKLFLDYTLHIAKQLHKTSIRIDTHYDNHSMQRFLAKNNFIPCGTIYLANHDQRIAFERKV